MKRGTLSIDNPVVPRALYWPPIESRQEVPGDADSVILRGCLGLRMERAGGPALYGVEVAMRYLRRLQVNECDPEKWSRWVYTYLIPQLCSRWWFNRFAQSLRWIEHHVLPMVSETRVVILGESVAYANTGARRIVKRMMRAQQPIVGTLPRLPSAIARATKQRNHHVNGIRAKERIEKGQKGTAS